LQRKIDAGIQERKAWTRIVTDTQRKLEEAKAQNSQLNDDAQALTEETHLLRTEKEQLQHGISARVVENDVLKDENIDLENENVNLKAELDRQADQVRELQGQIKKRDESGLRVKTLESENVKLKAQVESLEAEAKKVIAKHETYKKRVRALGNEM